jgi:hypothetical protein
MQTKRAFSTYHSLNKIQRQELLPLRKHLGTHRYFGGSVVLLIFLVFCVGSTKRGPSNDFMYSLGSTKFLVS